MRKDVLNGRLAGNRVQRAKSTVKVEQQHFVGDVSLHGHLSRRQRVQRLPDEARVAPRIQRSANLSSLRRDTLVVPAADADRLGPRVGGYLWGNGIREILAIRP